MKRHWFFDSFTGIIIGFVIGGIITIPPISVGLLGVPIAAVYPFTLVVAAATTVAGAYIQYLICKDK